MRLYTQLTREQRYQIYAFLKAGFSQSAIANEIGVHKSTISRELRRNRGKKGYRPKQAHALSKHRRAQSKKFIKLTPELIVRIESLIKLELGAGVGNLNRVFGLSVSHEAIYQYILKNKARGGNLYRHLRHANKKRKKRYGSYNRRGQILGRVSIDKRPVIVDTKKAHWRLGNRYCYR